MSSISHNILKKNLINIRDGGEVLNLKVLEIGTCGGVGTRLLLDIVNEKQYKGVVYSCDPFTRYSEKPDRNDEETYENFINEFEDDIKAKNLIFKREESFSFLTKLCTTGHYNSFDLIYIDGFHSARHVMEDFLLSYYLVKSGGLIVCDDYDWTPRHLRKGGFHPKDSPRASIDFIDKIFVDEVILVGDKSNGIFKKRNM